MFDVSNNHIDLLNTVAKLKRERQQEDAKLPPAATPVAAGVSKFIDAAGVSKFIDMLDNSDTDVLFDMLSVIRTHLNIGVGRGQSGGATSTCTAHVALVFASFKLARRIRNDEQEYEDDDTTPSSTKEQPEIIPPVDVGTTGNADTDADADADANGEEDNAKENDTTKNDKDKKDEEEESETQKKVDEENKYCTEEKGGEEETEEDKKPAAKEKIVSAEEEEKTKKKKTPKTVR